MKLFEDLKRAITSRIYNVQDDTHFTVNLSERDYKLYNDFLNEYNPSKDLKFNDIVYRKGAIITGSFGLEEGFKKDKDGKMTWGYARHHTGVDRAGGNVQQVGNKLIADGVVVPFNFNRSSIVDYGDTSYGTLISLFNDKYQFEFRIAHMSPFKQGTNAGILPDIMKILKSKGPIKRGTVLGSAGNYGDSTGAHTHTEIKSLDESCEVFEILLYELYGDDSLVEYTNDEIISIYKKYKQFKDANNSKILLDYNTLKKEKRIIFLNKYKCIYIDFDNTIKTRYSSEKLFNRL